jgi:GxxExxY protein
VKTIDDISGDILDVSIRTHRQLGPGLMESVYEIVLAGNLLDLGYSVERQRPIDIEFEGRRFEGSVQNRSARR